MYKKVELPNGFVVLEKEVANLWTARNVIKKNFDMNQDGEYFTFYAMAKCKFSRKGVFLWKNLKMKKDVKHTK